MLAEDGEGKGVLMNAGHAIERLKGHAARIGVLLKLEPCGSSCRILIDSSADLVLEELLVGYIEEEVDVLFSLWSPHASHTVVL